MNQLLRSQFIQMATTRTFKWFVASAVVIGVLGVCVLLGISEVSSPNTKRELLQDADLLNPPLSSLLLLVFGLIWGAGGYRHGTAVVEALITPTRHRVFFAKLFTYGAFGVIFGLVMVGVLAILLAVWNPVGWRNPQPLFEAIVQQAIVMGLSAMLGVSLGMLVPNQLVLVVAMLVYLFVVGPGIWVAMSALWDKTGSQIYSFTLQGALDDLQNGGVHSWGIGALIVVGWVALFGALTIALDRRRDIA